MAEPLGHAQYRGNADTARDQQVVLGAMLGMSGDGILPMIIPITPIRLVGSWGLTLLVMLAGGTAHFCSRLHLQPLLLGLVLNIHNGLKSGIPLLILAGSLSGTG